MKVLQRLMMFACVSVLLASCGDDGGITLTLSSPADGTTYTAGDVLSVSGTATDDIEVTRVTIEIADLITPLDIPGVGTATVPFTGTIDIVAGTPAMDNIKIIVTAVDSDGNTAVEEREVSIQ